jgi:hypothetical protein
VSAPDLVLSYLRDAPQGDGYSTEDLALLIHEMDFTAIDAEVRRLERRGSILQREGVWYAVGARARRPAPAAALGLSPRPPDLGVAEEIKEARAAVRAWTAHLKALEAYRAMRKE